MQPTYLTISGANSQMGAGHPVGAAGVRQVLKYYQQVTGKAGDYQVYKGERSARLESGNSHAGHEKRAATLNIGGSGTTSICFTIGSDA